MIEYLTEKNLFAFRLFGIEARVLSTIACVAQDNASVPDQVLKLRSKHWCVRLRTLTSIKHVLASFHTQGRSLTPSVRFALLAERERPYAERLHAPLSLFRSA